MSAEWIDYDLPSELIAQYPTPNRVDARLMVVRRAEQTLEHCHIRDLPETLQPGDRVVVNNTKVIPAALRGHRKETGGRWQGLYLGANADGTWNLVCKARGTLREPEAIVLDDREGRPAATLWLLNKGERGVWRAQLEGSESPFALLERIGRTPLPPYIRGGAMSDADEERYQTVFARCPGAVAAPTAGLHFTARLMRAMEKAQIAFSAVTLHVGQGTFQPITTSTPDAHQMHAEWCELNELAAAQIATTRAARGRIVAVGTTVVRLLETAARFAKPGDAGNPPAWQGETDLFIRPGFAFQTVDALLTNFHFPRTTLLLLVQALGGSELIRRAYQEAIKQEYRFYSYGDAMLIL